MKFVGLLSVLFVCALIFIDSTAARPQQGKKDFARESQGKPDDLEAGAEADLEGAESSYVYGGYYPSYSYPSYNRRYSYPYYGGYGYYGSAPYNSNFYRSLGGYYGGLFY